MQSTDLDAVPSTSNPGYFDYSALAPAVWGLRFDSIRSEGVSRVTVPVLWGVHEQLRGIREFYKPTRLRLERLLSTAQEKGFEVDLALGFPAHPESFPQWTHPLEPQALVPLALWEGERGPVSLKKIPSLGQPEIREAFVGFLEEVHRIVRLYFAPEGPVREVRLDLGILAHDVSVGDERLYRESLGERYGDITRLNRVYGTAFRDFASAVSSTGVRVLCDKRPWLAAYDLKWCRSRRLGAFETFVLEHPRLKGLFRCSSAPGAQPDLFGFGIGFDPTLVEGRTGVGGCPSLPNGLVNGAAATAFRLWEYLMESAAEARLPVYFLSDSVPPYAVHTVVSGPFLARAQAESLAAAARAGARLFFPFGLPKYDENLSSHNAFEGPTSYGETALGPAIRIALGKGEILSTATPPPLEDSLWESLERWRAALMEEPAQ